MFWNYVQAYIKEEECKSSIKSDFNKENFEVEYSVHNPDSSQWGGIKKKGNTKYKYVIQIF